MTASVPRNADSWTLDDLVDFPEDGNRYEIIEGDLLVSPAPAKPHLRVLSRLHRLLNRHAPDELAVSQNAGVLVAAGKVTYFIPDLIVLRDDVLDGDEAALKPADVLLAVEVLSPGRHATDEVTKRYCYARMGIPQYWIVDPDTVELTVLVLDADQRYRDAALVRAGERWHTDEPFPIDLDPAGFC
jgi:Uma2 family endonuclease